MYLGDYAAGSILYTHFTITDSTGLPATLSGTPVVKVYKDDNNTESTSGITLTADFDSRTGLNNLKIDTSSDGTFYAAGHDFSAVITTGTAGSGGTSVVGYVIAKFSLKNRYDGSITFPTNFASLSIDASGRVDIIKINGTSQTARDLGASVLLSSGTGAGQISLSSGAVLLQATQTGVTIPTVTTLTNAPPDSSGVTTLLARVGAFTGSGINTVLGFFKAIMKKDAAATPSDVGGTFDNTTDSLEAIKDTGLTVSGSVNVSSMDAGVIGASQIASGAITAAKFATDAIDANALKADAVTEIQNGLATASALTTLTDYATRTVIRGTVSGASPTTTSFTCSALDIAGSIVDQFKGRILVFDKATTTAALRGQATDITTNTVATLPVLTFTALTTAPASGDTFSII